MEAQVSSESVEHSKDNTENSTSCNNIPFEDKEPSVEKSAENSIQNVEEITGPFHVVETEAKKESYETAFENFLRQANEKAAESESSVKKGDDAAENETDQVQASASTFVPNVEDTSNSSWYKMKSGSEEKMDTTENVTLPDESSNLSVPDNGSVASSNIGDSCLSYQDQTLNLDEGSNISIPESSSPKYTGHQPDFDESANMNPPSNAEFVRPDTPNRPETPSRPDTPSSTMDGNSESTPVKRYRRGTLQIAAEDASEHGQ
jgi:hypothetical protein